MFGADDADWAIYRKIVRSLAAPSSAFFGLLRRTLAEYDRALVGRGG